MAQNDLTEEEKQVLLRIDGTEDVAPHLKAGDVLHLMRIAKKQSRELDRLRDLPSNLRQDIEGSGAIPGVIMRAQKAVTVAHDAPLTPMHGDS